MASVPATTIEAPSPFGTLLRQYRLAAGLSQEALAERAGLSARAVSDLERGARQTPYPHTVRQLARALRLPSADRDRLVASCPRRLGGPPLDHANQAPPTNLPATLTSFVGRERELAEVRRQLDAARLVTLTGSGGVGKTRLALEAARAADGDYPAGVWLVELASLADPALVPRAVAVALGVHELPEHRGRTPTEALAAWLAAKALLLVLDNCEHLIDACATLVERLLRAAPRLRVLATSREPLGIAGEQAWPTPALALPDLGSLPPAARLGQVEAVRLFAERASCAAPRFALSEHNAAAVAAICWRLDGLPLAIELAAARVAALPPAEIAARLDDRFALLTGGSRTAPPRQQTLRATLDWSYDLLDEAERALLRRLAAFAGGFTLAAAEVVVAGEGVVEGDVLDLLTRLVTKSLVQVEDQGETARYRLLETVRAYGWRRLREAGETDLAQRRHAAWCAALAEQAEPALDTRDQLGWLACLDAEQDNLRAALAWSLEHDPAINLRLAAGLTRYWLLRGRSAEGRDWLGRRLARAPAPAADRARALWCAGQLAAEQVDFTIARARFEECLRLSRAAGDGRLAARSLNYLASIAAGHGDSPVARSLLEEGLTLIRPTGDRYGLAQILWDLADSARRAGDVARAEALTAEALALARQLGERELLSASLWRLGLGALANGDLAAAQALFEEGLLVADEIGAPRRMANLRGDLGQVACARGDLDQARDWLESALAVARSADDECILAWTRCYLGRIAWLGGDLAGAAALLEQSMAGFKEHQPEGNGITRQMLGRVAWARGDAATACARLRESLAIWQATGNRKYFAECLEALAALAAGTGGPERAARLLGAADGLREAAGSRRWPVEEPEHQATVAATRAALGEAAFACAWEAGRAAPLEQIVAEELEAS
jgi:predicted ATPase/DNA-binding XRE family transcriptional regulator